MTRTQIAEGLSHIVLGLANNSDLSMPPEDLSPHEWAYIKGIASGELLRLRDRLVQIGAEYGS